MIYNLKNGFIMKRIKEDTPESIELDTDVFEIESGSTGLLDEIDEELYGEQLCTDVPVTETVVNLRKPKRGRGWGPAKRGEVLVKPSDLKCSKEAEDLLEDVFSTRKRASTAVYKERVNVSQVKDDGFPFKKDPDKIKYFKGKNIPENREGFVRKGEKQKLVRDRKDVGKLIGKEKERLAESYLNDMCKKEIPELDTVVLSENTRFINIRSFMALFGITRRSLDRYLGRLRLPIHKIGTGEYILSDAMDVVFNYMLSPGRPDFIAPGAKSRYKRFNKIDESLKANQTTLKVDLKRKAVHQILDSEIDELQSRLNKLREDRYKARLKHEMKSEEEVDLLEDEEDIDV